MWYEIVPTVALVWACIAIPSEGQKLINWLTMNGKLRCRDWERDPRDFHAYLRDRRITGSEYKPRGLEGIDQQQ